MLYPFRHKTIFSYGFATTVLKMTGLDDAALCDVTAIPIFIPLAIVTDILVSALPQVDPSLDLYAVKVLPTLVSFIYWGSVYAPSDTVEALPFVVERYWKFSPFDGVMTSMTNVLPAALDSRYMMPPFAHPLVFPCESTRRDMSESPDADWLIYEN